LTWIDRLVDSFCIPAVWLRQRRDTPRGARWTTFSAALAMSALLHAMALVLPLDFGDRSSQPHSVLRQRAAGDSRLEVRLMRQERVAAQVAVSGGSETGHEAQAVVSASEMSREARPGLFTPVRSILMLGQEYFTPDQLTRAPQPFADVELDPPQLREILAAGRMILSLWIDENGAVRDVVVEDSNMDKAFERVAVTAFSKAQFVPGERFGRPVRTVVRIEITYADGRIQPK
jgi:TonB family protein